MELVLHALPSKVNQERAKQVPLKLFLTIITCSDS